MIDKSGVFSMVVDPSTKEINLRCAQEKIRLLNLEAIRKDLLDIYHSPENILKKGKKG